jgi:hypothetical protein
MNGWGSWNGPAAAYELTAALAEADPGAARAALGGLGAAELRGVVIALGAQARHAAVVAGQRPGAARLREQERAGVRVVLSGSPALPLALAALEGTADLAAPAQEPGECLAAAAIALATVTIHAMVTAGWPPRAVAVICRRAAL